MSTHASQKPSAETGTERPEIVRAIAVIRERLERLRGDGKVIGLVPTMGSLHEGHLSLVRAARQECDIVVVSIFINPIQFGPSEDLDLYPSDIDSDVRLLSPEGVDFVFAPAAAELYPPGFETRVDVGGVTEGLCGQNRPGHFAGVATVVAKLFNIIAPGKVYFGEKDAQQLAVIRQLTRDLDFDIEVIGCPIVRDDTGLALSSRNAFMNEEERSQAAVLFEALTRAGEAVAAGESSAASIRRMMRKLMGSQYLVEFEYARVVDLETLKEIETIEGPVLLAVAAKVGNARLIDNIKVEPGGAG